MTPEEAGKWAQIASAVAASPFLQKILGDDAATAALLAAPAPGLKHVVDHPYLQGRVRVFLDDVEITKRCEAFDVASGEVVMQKSVGGLVVLDWTCACGTSATNERPTRRSRCPVCQEPLSVEVARETLHGVVRVEQKPYEPVPEN